MMGSPTYPEVDFNIIFEYMEGMEEKKQHRTGVSG